MNPPFPDFETLTLEVECGVARVRFDHGPMNLLDAQLVPELMRLADRLEGDDAVRVVVFESANPDYFLSHADVRLLQTMRDAGQYDGDEMPLYAGLLERFRTMPKACIAKVAGRANGGGAEFVLAMDMAFIASESGRLSQMEIVLGILPGGGGAQYLARKVGRSRAMEICLGGAELTAREAERYGYVNRAVPDAELDEFVDALARRIASYPARSIALNKASVNLHEEGRREEFVSANRWFVELAREEDFDARVERFLAAGGQTAEGELGSWREWARLLADPGAPASG
ncbi:MAG: enoyl-CoA hydratase/isomerase family protein [bacterium]|nr:enoyl-CoA hydratase/isomerase family protein [bacterium]